MTSLVIPRVIGHRGAKAYAPENTLSSIHAAADLGCEWVEVDVKLSKDSEAIIFHDEELIRCTGVNGLVKDFALAELREMDAGSWYGESFLNERIPTLEELLNTVLERGMGVNLEIKPCPGREKETAEVMLDVATRIWPDDAPPPLVSSFQHVSLETAMDMMEEWPRGFLMDEHLENWQELAQYLNAATININGNTATRDQIEEYMEYQKPILAYTINDQQKAKELVRWGVDAVFSDNPDTIMEILSPKH
ncbi:MAG: glycerophosphoryl diester phosphodiesterase [Alphaproteobacteria bacterium]|nr:glycerophosphoryl diester phosphodiesterase [Alphaproteobacteria bacterium]